MDRERNKDAPVGWNDPPLFSYNDTIAHTSSTKRTMLNKRVPFTGNPTYSTASGIDPTLPPSATFSSPPPKTDATISTSLLENIENNEDESNYANKADILQSVMENLKLVIDQKEELKSDNVKKELILKKIDTMKMMWLDDKLLPIIYKQMLKLSELLRDGNKEEANHIQIGLMVDHPRYCSTWIPAIRQLINL